MQRFTELRVWQTSHALVLSIYQLTRRFPSDERFGLSSQIRRAALSVPTNIAEGSKRQSNTDYARFLNISEGSLAETEYLLMVSRDLGYASAETVAPLLSSIKEIAGGIHTLRLKVAHFATVESKPSKLRT